MKLVDTLDEQALLEDEIEATKPPLPPDCARLDYLLATPFRYGRYPGNSRFRREGYSPGVFYASEVVETAVAETAFYRLLFFSESPGTPWPRNALEFTAFESRYATKRGIDLLAQPFARHAEHWTHLTDYTACLALADAAHQAGIEIDLGNKVGLGSRIVLDGLLRQGEIARDVGNIERHRGRRQSQFPLCKETCCR